MTRFQVGNLLDAPPGNFDLVLCRNVLGYFAPEAARRACQNLVSALAPGGVLVFGALDLPAAPPGCARVGPAELQIYRRLDRPRASLEQEAR